MDAQPNPVIIPALYVPKSVTFDKRADGSFKIQIKGANVAAFVAWALGLGFLFFIWPWFLFLAGGVISLFLFVLAIGIPIYVTMKGGPVTWISPAGVQIGSKLYRREDIAAFVDSAEDSWLAVMVQKLGLTFVGLQYGIYAVRTPYLLNAAEALKVAPFLSQLLMRVGDEFGAERARKIQQAEIF